MEENQPKTGKFALNFGLLLGVISIIFAFMLYTVDMHYQGGIPVMSISLALSLAMVIIAMIQFKKANGGFMTFGQGLKIGVGVCLIGGIIGIIFNQIMATVIDPDMMNKAMEFQKNQLLETTKMTIEQVEAQMELGKPFTTPTMQMVFGLIFSVVIGFVLSLVPALVLKKNENLN
ncbi:DUF4199 domain-containing protein [Maribacter arcticus]|jgi:glucan phosphoethanolaminetransferase (alkaline phosphatase superfamily)|uniref:DUF4199 domain-containing protein n=1 Tax=Maribacter arcticus TaxID=561365 RepID=A0A1T5E3Q2_9FLAO|nr:DUF4199 domain-containing protein [Maribacter arcticus]SKB78393.1 Protein of unknown function [Maribacter arcticus]|tara:strand:- start:1 stop:525 length:525 start_codon:yes stop_codon:yes gene_type:complete